MVLFRDLDSRPSQREKAAVEQWLRSKHAFHVMRDHPGHDMAMLAGKIYILFRAIAKPKATLFRYVRNKNVLSGVEAGAEVGRPRDAEKSSRV